ncbi:MAG TPA: MATE family efflux transporter, partial [Beijerinckiaceae bacterium]|nr:MATE family efflux transporter [Beijerinckiaceae bacterium]
MTPPPARLNARLTTGSTLRHVVTMTFAGSLGLIAIFLVDFLSLFYISLLKDEKLTAGVGYATSVLFVAISFSIGLMIAVSAVVARRLGAGDREAARKAATTGVVLSAATGAAV